MIPRKRPERDERADVDEMLEDDLAEREPCWSCVGAGFHDDELDDCGSTVRVECEECAGAGWV